MICDDAFMNIFMMIYDDVYVCTYDAIRWCLMIIFMKIYDDVYDCIFDDVWWSLWLM
jgi:hypothetical protein